MLKRLLSILLVAGAPVVALAATDGYITAGEGGQAWCRGISEAPVFVMTHASVAGATDAEFDNITEGTARAVTFTYGSSGTGAVLDAVLIASTNCANCDVAILEVASTGGTRLLWWSTTIGSETIPDVYAGTAYSQYANVLVGRSVTSGSVVVVVSNKDAEATNDEDVTVRLWWRSQS